MLASLGSRSLGKAINSLHARSAWFCLSQCSWSFIVSRVFLFFFTTKTCYVEVDLAFFLILFLFTNSSHDASSHMPTFSDSALYPSYHLVVSRTTHVSPFRNQGAHTLASREGGCAVISRLRSLPNPLQLLTASSGIQTLERPAWPWRSLRHTSSMCQLYVKF